MFNIKVLLGRKRHGSIIITTLQVQISAHLALELSRKELKMFFTQFSQAPKHYGNDWIENSEIVWVDDAFPDDIMEILIDEDFNEGSMELNLDPQYDSNAENIDD